jgi:hypothetical protein
MVSDGLHAMSRRGITALEEEMDRLARWVAVFVS